MFFDCLFVCLFQVYSNIIHSSIARCMFFFGFYYAVLSRGPCPVVGSCWLFYRVMFVYIHLHLLISFAHYLSLLVAIRWFAMLWGCFCLVKKFICIIFRIHLQEISHTCLPLSYLRHFVLSSLLHSLLLDMAWCHLLYGWVILPCVCTPSCLRIHLSLPT